jgi:hypothetical protein
LPPDCTVTPRTAGISSGEKIDNVKALSPAVGRKTRRKKALIGGTAFRPRLLLVSIGEI